jgi:ASC-1-like (ASCH) protein
MKTHRVVFRAVDRAKFDDVRRGVKTIETRAGTPKYQNIEAGDELLFVCGKDSFTKRITAVKHFDSLDAMFDELPLKSIMPWANTRAEAYQTYYSFPTYKEKLAEYGIVAFELEQ